MLARSERGEERKGSEGGESVGKGRRKERAHGSQAEKNDRRLDSRSNGLRVKHKSVEKPSPKSEKKETEMNNDYLKKKATEEARRVKAKKKGTLPAKEPEQRRETWDQVEDVRG